ncbi:hypothetical protein O6H91_04G024000 [Diphasiastrum complanatum]|uniref:Uncharacterized protein n=1 Tax=Diphasiastrum complanatum TaxID=34168 RepID=A0ACC2DUU0_DIPCM|nr:hypothetical protein O6H91_04G024000 [Diphasiastrum complanatum]
MAANEHLRIWFQSVDTDQSGSINVAELQQALAAGNLQFPATVIAQMIRMYDKDQSGTMSFEEFVSLHKFLTLVQNSFMSNERERGILGLNEVYSALQQAGYPLDRPSFYTTCQSFDRNRTGKFRLDDFISMCIFLQSAKNLFGAFDTSKEGRVSLDFNQFVYCSANLRI